MQKRKIWTISMSLVAVALFGSAKAAQGQGDVEQCYSQGEHVLADQLICQLMCCAHSCGACATDGHYVCG